ncbi:hypothetical protein FRC12_018462, partial [Ceratobasidium sp. 428]
MSLLNLPKLLGLPPSRNGRAIAYLIPVSLILAITQLGLTAISVGFWQYYIPLAIASLTIVHHVIILCILFYIRRPSRTHVPHCLTRGMNVTFLLLFDAVWISETGVGFWFWTMGGWLADDTPYDRPGQQLASNVFALLECLVLGALAVFCELARRERRRELKGVRQI